MDLSKVPDLELRQKVGRLLNQIDFLDDKIGVLTAALHEQRRAAWEEKEDLLGDLYVEGICTVTGLPIFNTDETVETKALACVANGTMTEPADQQAAPAA